MARTAPPQLQAEPGIHQCPRKWDSDQTAGETKLKRRVRQRRWRQRQTKQARTVGRGRREGVAAGQPQSERGMASSNTVPNRFHTVPNRSSTVSSRSHTVPNRSHTVVCQNVPTLCQTVPTLCQTVPTLCQTVPTLCQTVPTLSRTVPALCQTVPALCQTVPTLCQTVPTLCRTVPTLCRTVPVLYQTIPELLCLFSYHRERGECEARVTTLQPFSLNSRERIAPELLMQLQPTASSNLNYPNCIKYTPPHVPEALAPGGA